jgi:hypothetical protein
MSHNKKYIKKKFKVMFGNMKSPTMYAELLQRGNETFPLHNGKYTKTYVNTDNEITSAYITLDEYAAALGHILLRKDGYKYFENTDNNNTDIAI